MIGSSNSDVSTLPRLPNVNIVDLFLRATREEKRRASSQEIIIIKREEKYARSMIHFSKFVILFLSTALWDMVSVPAEIKRNQVKYLF